MSLGEGSRLDFCLPTARGFGGKVRSPKRYFLNADIATIEKHQNNRIIYLLVRQHGFEIRSTARPGNLSMYICDLDRIVRSNKTACEEGINGISIVCTIDNCKVLPGVEEELCIYFLDGIMNKQTNLFKTYFKDQNRIRNDQANLHAALSKLALKSDGRIDLAAAQIH